jgi:hypothetical protein
MTEEMKKRFQAHLDTLDPSSVLTPKDGSKDEE